MHISGKFRLVIQQLGALGIRDLYPLTLNHCAGKPVRNSPASTAVSRVIAVHLGLNIFTPKVQPAEQSTSAVSNRMGAMVMSACSHRSATGRFTLGWCLGLVACALEVVTRPPGPSDLYFESASCIRDNFVKRTC